ncbi:MAG: hypothetical protein BWY49_01295 [Candidatus Omnitrophica bacterium ADurb.Bin314]|nr:MAG: hypothetical protein BWY49_01295 [Candidatus Omnitrophica bacterium ADurb.Bin314]
MGPTGMGPMTGGGRGFCGRPAGAIRGIGRTGARGGRGWRNQFNATGLTGWQRTYPVQPAIGGKKERELLKKQAACLSGELDAVRSRLTELEKEQKQKKQK